MLFGLMASLPATESISEFAHHGDVLQILDRDLRRELLGDRGGSSESAS